MRLIRLSGGKLTLGKTARNFACGGVVDIVEAAFGISARDSAEEGFVHWRLCALRPCAGANFAAAVEKVQRIILQRKQF